LTIVELLQSNFNYISA